jgi:branched-chain amino acid transport system substrate-binding protein
VYMRKTALAVGAAAALASALSACGSSSHSASHSQSATGARSAASAPSTTGAQSSTGSQSTTAASGASTPTGASFNLGAICSCGGVQAASLAALKEVSNVWAQSVNASGGINGHPVKVTAMDDAGNPATALQDVKQLVESDHVQALVSDGSLADGSFASYLATSGVPVVGGIAASVPFMTNPDFFDVGSNAVVQTVGLAQLAKAAGKHKLGVMYCSESPLCAQLVPIAKGATQLAGIGFASATISSTAPSYAAPCLAMKSQNVDALFIADNTATAQRVVDACAQQGYRPAITEESGTASSAWLHDPNFNGVLLTSSNPGYTDSTNPGVTTFLAALKKYDPSLLNSTSFTYDTIYPWIAGQLFAAAAKAGHLTPTSTPAEVKQALYKANGTTLGGLSAPLPILPNKPVFTACYYGLTIKNGAYADLNGGKPDCLTAAQATALAASLKKS